MNPLVRAIQSHIVRRMLLKQHMWANAYPIEIFEFIMRISWELLQWTLDCKGGYVYFIVQNEIFIWGSNERGHSASVHNIPRRISAGGCYNFILEGIEEINQDRARRLVLTDNNIVLSCSNEHGLGLGTCRTEVSLRQISIPNANRIYLGSHTAFIITNTGDAYATGDNRYGQLGIECADDQESFVKVNFPEPNLRIVKIACGRRHTLFLAVTGNVYVCGLNTSGQLGLFISNNNLGLEVPRKVKLSPDSTLDHIIDICCGDHCSMAITSDGRLYTWGNNEFGQLGLGNNHNQSGPQLVSFPEF